MTRPIVVTGAASGIGAATLARLREKGEVVLGVDLAGSDVAADLSHVDGRLAMQADIARRAPEGIAGIVAVAGTAKLDDPALIISTNYFGAVATFDLLRPMLEGAARPRGVVVASSAALLPHDRKTVQECLTGDESRARAAAQAEPAAAYAASKQALGLWLRRTAVAPSWAGSGICLNGVAPGTVKTPMTLPLLATEEGKAILRASTPIAVDDYGEPRDLAEILAFLATFEGRYLIGQMLFVDGGTDALLRPEIF